MNRWWVWVLVAFLIVAAWALFLTREPEIITFEPDGTEAELSSRDPFVAFLRRVQTPTLEYPRIAVLDSGGDPKLFQREGISATLAPLSDGGLDEVGHGTGVILQLAARENGFGVVGYLPGLPILSFKLATHDALLSGGIPFESLERAFDEARRFGAKIISMSVSNHSRRWPLDRMQSLLRHYREILVIAAAGNDGRKLRYGKGCEYTPICNRADNLIKVGARDYLSGNRGEVVDTTVVSRVYAWRRYETQSNARVYEVKELLSTSVAAPKVAALAAFLWAWDSSLHPAAIKQKIIDQLKSR